MAGLYPDSFIDKVRESNDVVSVISEYVQLERRGKDYFGICPFHREKTPSFSVAPAKQIFYCFGCNKGGNVIHFIMDVERLSFTEALVFLANKAGITVPEVSDRHRDQESGLKKEILGINKEAARFYFSFLNDKQGGKGDAGKNYLNKRGIGERAVRRFGLGYAPDEWDALYKHIIKKGFSNEAVQKCGLFKKNKNGGLYDAFRGRLMFPIFNVSGSVIAFGGRIIKEDGAEKHAKYINSPETPVYIKGNHLYGLNFIKAKHLTGIIVVEGYMDVISLCSAGCTNVVASLGTALTEVQGRMMKRFAEEIIICYDSDSAGQKATLRGMEILKGLGCLVKVLSIDDGKDPDEYIKRNGITGFNTLVNNAETLVEYRLRTAKEASNINSIEGKTRFLKDAAKILSEIDVAVEHEMYLQKISDEYNISVSALKELVKKEDRTPAVPLSAELNKMKTELNIQDNIALLPEEKSVLEKLIYDERMILAFLCMDKRLLLKVKNELSESSYSDNLNNGIAVVIYRILTDNPGMTIPEIMDKLDREQINAVGALLQRDCVCDDVPAAIERKLKEVIIGRLDMQIINIKKELRSVGDAAEKTDLVKKLSNKVMERANLLKT